MLYYNILSCDVFLLKKQLNGNNLPLQIWASKYCKIGMNNCTMYSMQESYLNVNKRLGTMFYVSVIRSHLPGRVNRQCDTGLKYNTRNSSPLHHTLCAFMCFNCII